MHSGAQSHTHKYVYTHALRCTITYTHTHTQVGKPIPLDSVFYRRLLSGQCPPWEVSDPPCGVLPEGPLLARGTYKVCVFVYVSVCVYMCMRMCVLMCMFVYAPLRAPLRA